MICMILTPLFRCYMIEYFLYIEYYMIKNFKIFCHFSKFIFDYPYLKHNPFNGRKRNKEYCALTLTYKHLRGSWKKRQNLTFLWAFVSQHSLNIGKMKIKNSYLVGLFFFLLDLTFTFVVRILILNFPFSSFFSKFI